VELAPLAAIAVGVAGRVEWLAAVGAGSALLATVTTIAPLYRNTGAIWPALLWPVGWPLMASGVLRSAWLVHRRGGVMWRGTFYSKEEVIAAQRYRLGSALVDAPPPDDRGAAP
jgi:hypothetical protein